MAGERVTRESIREYTEAVRQRYFAVSKAEKGRILEEFCATTGYHRKAAIRLIRRGLQPPRTGRGRPEVYGSRVSYPLRVAWEASDQLCSKRLAPFLAELVPLLEAHGELELDAATRKLLLAVRPTTIDHLLRPFRRTGLRRPYQSSHSPLAIKSQVPIRTFGEWRGEQPGALQVDLVLHCGDQLVGHFLATLTAVDVATGWVECLAVDGTRQRYVARALYRIQQRLPFPLRSVHSDNGTEFLNHELLAFCRQEDLQFTRGRPYRKNDQAWVEQKNWSVVRRLVGYDRYSSAEALQRLELAYELVRSYVNLFQPVRKLVSKERVGARVTKRYDAAATPFQRVLASGQFRADQYDHWERRRRQINPYRLRHQIEEALIQLHAHRERHPLARSQ
jgi:hypothetical protein